MALPKITERWFIKDLRGKYGPPTGVGDFWLGYSEAGNDDPLSGVWQKRRTLTGIKPCRMRYYITPNPRTVAQQANRNKLAQAIIEWNALTLEQQKVWNLKKRPVRCSGYNRFISNYIKIH